jgi:hypothetical protein
MTESQVLWATMGRVRQWAELSPCYLVGCDTVLRRAITLLGIYGITETQKQYGFPSLSLPSSFLYLFSSCYESELTFGVGVIGCLHLLIQTL